MEKLKGSISLCDAQEGVALVTQEPWIQHASIKYVQLSLAFMSFSKFCYLLVLQNSFWNFWSF